MENQGYLSQKIANVVMKEISSSMPADDSSPVALLSSRETEILQLVAEGRNSQEIADRLCISVKTISGHRRQLMDKLKVDSVAALTKIAIREGLVTLDV